MLCSKPVPNATSHLSKLALLQLGILQLDFWHHLRVISHKRVNWLNRSFHLWILNIRHVFFCYLHKLVVLFLSSIDLLYSQAWKDLFSLYLGELLITNLRLLGLRLLIYIYFRSVYYSLLYLVCSFLILLSLYLTFNTTRPILILSPLCANTVMLCKIWLSLFLRAVIHLSMFEVHILMCCIELALVQFICEVGYKFW